MLVQLVSSHGMLAILEVLEGKCSRDVLMKLLHIINLVMPVQNAVEHAVDPQSSLLPVTLASWRASVLSVASQ